MVAPSAMQGGVPSAIFLEKPKRSDSAEAIVGKVDDLERREITASASRILFADRAILC